MESCRARTEQTTVHDHQSEEDAVLARKVLDVKIEPLFSLPSELMSPKKHKRKRNETFKEKKEKTGKFRETSYTANRLREEDFRRYKK